MSRYKWIRNDKSKATTHAKNVSLKDVTASGVDKLIPRSITKLIYTLRGAIEDPWAR